MSEKQKAETNKPHLPELVEYWWALGKTTAHLSHIAKIIAESDKYPAHVRYLAQALFADLEHLTAQLETTYGSLKGNAVLDRVLSMHKKLQEILALTETEPLLALFDKKETKDE